MMTLNVVTPVKSNAKFFQYDGEDSEEFPELTEEISEMAYGLDVLCDGSHAPMNMLSPSGTAKDSGRYSEDTARAILRGHRNLSKRKEPSGLVKLNETIKRKVKEQQKRKEGEDEGEEEDEEKEGEEGGEEEEEQRRTRSRRRGRRRRRRRRRTTKNE